MANKRGARSGQNRERSMPRPGKKTSEPKSVVASRHGRGVKRAPSRKRGALHSEQIYAGFHKTADRMATLTEVQDPRVPTRTIGELSHTELKNLVHSRIKNDESFTPLHMLGVDGVVDKDRALREVQAGSHIGLHLIDIEKEYIALQLARSVDAK